jgi:ComF family protein
MLQRFLNLFLQTNCPLCQRPTAREFCQDCDRQLQRCQLPPPHQFGQGDLPVFVWGNYAGALKRAIAALKYEQQPQLATPLGHWLGQAWLKSSASKSLKKPLVVPIPLHSTKLKQRGYNQAELLAQSFCQITGLKMQPGLERIRATEAQFNLSPAERSQNLVNAFKVHPQLQRRIGTNPVLLLDDIYTTGATANAATQTLHQQGIVVCGLVAIATTQKQNSMSL